jgi:hypothetical protein
VSRPIALIVVVAALGSWAQRPELAIPPSEAWAEEADPGSLPSAEAHGRLFRRRGNESVTLRVVTDPRRMFDYLPPLIGVMANRAEVQGAGDGPKVRVLDATSLEIDGAPVAKIITASGERRTSSYVLPCSQGDLAVTLVTGDGDGAIEEEIGKWILGAKGLRRPALSAAQGVDAGLVLFFVMALVFIASLFFLVWATRRRKSSTSRS